MAPAREQAQTNLGSIRDYVNYGGYQAERDNAQNNYDTSIKSLEFFLSIFNASSIL